MNAIDYIKKYDIARVKLDLSIVDNHGYNSLFTEDFSKQLKQTVDAFDLVEYWGGLKHCKHLVKSCEIFGVEKIGSKSHDLSKETTCDKLKHALELVEKCNES